MLNQDIYNLARDYSVPIEKVAGALKLSKQQLIKKLSKKITSDFRYNIIYIIFHLSRLLDDTTADFYTDIYCGDLKLEKRDYNTYNVLDCNGVIVGCIGKQQAKERGII